MSTDAAQFLGKYRIQDVLGEGAMGVVYRAHDAMLERPVAVKVMTAAIAQHADLRDRFLREARAAGALQHPNVVTVYDFGEANGHLYIAMELVDGADLAHVLARQEPPSLDAKLRIVADVLAGLGYAHQHGVVHRDVKPANIRVTPDGRAKLMDFGIAQVGASDLTRTGIALGTPSYMAPEQVTGGKVTGAADLFATGVVLYELLAGVKPFEGPSLHSILFKIASEEPPPLETLVPGIAPALVRVVARALAKDPAARYQSAAEMARDLAAVRAALEAGDTGVAPTAAGASPAPPRTRMAWIGGGLAACALAAVAVAVAATGGRSAPAAAPVPAPSARSSLSPSPGPAPEAASAIVPAPAASPVAPAATVVAGPGPRETPPAASLAALPAASLPPRPGATGAGRVAPAPAVMPPASLPGPGADAAPTPPPSAAAPAAPPADAPPPTAAPASTPASASTEVAETVRAYARAIESRDLAAVRRAYPGLTDAQERGFRQFFDAARGLRVSFAVNGLEVSGAAAEAQLVGAYEYATADGQHQRQPVSFSATLRREAGAWRLASVR